LESITIITCKVNSGHIWPWFRFWCTVSNQQLGTRNNLYISNNRKECIRGFLLMYIISAFFWFTIYINVPIYLITSKSQLCCTTITTILFIIVYFIYLGLLIHNAKMGPIVFTLIRMTCLCRAHYGLLLSINHRSLQLINVQIQTGIINIMNLSLEH
jgi:hypothetical protein